MARSGTLDVADGLLNFLKPRVSIPKTSPERLAAIREWSKANPERTKAASARYRERHPDRRKASCDAWDRANAERKSVKASEWWAANPDKARRYAAQYATRHPESRRASQKRWREANRPYKCVAQQKRKALQLSAPGRGVNPTEWRGAVTQSLGICVYCNERKPLTMDHIEPLSLGGAHDIENIAAVCASCNSSKNDTPLVIWFARRALARAV